MIGTSVDGWRRKSSSKLSSSNHRRKNKQCDSDLVTSSSTSTIRGPCDVVQKLSQDLHNCHVTDGEPIKCLRPMNLFMSDDSDEKMNEDDFARAEKQGQIPHDSCFDTIDDDDAYNEALSFCQEQKCSAVFKTESLEDNSRRKRSSSDEGLVLGEVMENREKSLGLTAEQLKRIEENRCNALEKRSHSRRHCYHQREESLVADTFNPIQSNLSVQSLTTCQTERPHISDSKPRRDGAGFVPPPILLPLASNYDIDNDENDEEMGAIDVDALRSCQKKKNAHFDGVGLFQVEELVASTPAQKRPETLTQFWPHENPKKKARIYVLDDSKNIVSVQIKKTILGQHKECVTFQRGDVWISDDRRFAYKLGYIKSDGQVYYAIIDDIWTRLDNTYIGPNSLTTSEKKRLGCEWVLLEKGKHPHMPPNERIKLYTLSNKLDDAIKPLFLYSEDKTSVSYRRSTPNQTAPHHNSDRPIACDLFAGGGGVSVGFEKAGWNVKYKADMNEACCKTLRKNFKGKHVYQVDVANLLPEFKSIVKSKIKYIHASSPCQGFSTANTGGGINDRQNKDCMLDFLDIVADIKPPFVSLENVPGCDSKRQLNPLDPENKFYLQTVIAKLLSLGYNVSKTITMASNFGDPQDRKRLILFASKPGFTLPTLLQTHGVGFLPKVTIGNVLRDLEDIEPNCDGRITINGKNVEGHFCKGTEFTNGTTPHEKDSRPKAEYTACTLTKKNKIVHYNHKRYLSLLEYKRLMSFPDDYVICGRTTDIRDQIGNAVPCRFAEAIGKAVMRSYTKEE